MRAARGEGAQAGREELPPLARRERPNDPTKVIFRADGGRSSNERAGIM